MKTPDFFQRNGTSNIMNMPQTVNLAEIRTGPNGIPMIIQSGMWIAMPHDQVPFIIEAAKHAEDIKAGKSVSFDFPSETKFQMTVSFAPFSKQGARRETRTHCTRTHLCTCWSTHATLTPTLHASQLTRTISS